MKTAFWIITAIVLIILGIVIFCGAMNSLNWDVTKLSTSEFETENYLFGEEIKNITVDTDTADLFITPSETDGSKVVCYEEENVKHNVYLEDGSLFIEVEDNRKWFERIGFSFKKSKIDIYIPKGDYNTLTVKSDTGNVTLPEEFCFDSVNINLSTGNVNTKSGVTESLKIESSTGSVEVENAKASCIDLSTSTGKIQAKSLTCGDVILDVSTGRTILEDISCTSLSSKGDTGSITLKNVIVENRLSVSRSTGSVKFDRCDGGEIFVETDTGLVSGTLLTDKVFVTKTDTGKINVPNSASGGRCEINTATGNIKLSIIS